MSPQWNDLVARAHALKLKIGPMTERPDGAWRVYLQRGTEIFAFAEKPTLEVAFEEVLTRIEKEFAPKAESYLD